MLRRGLVMIGVMLVFGAAGAAPAAASSGYTFTNLLTCCTAVGGGAAFDNNAVIADGINNLGDIALTGYGIDGHEHAFIWKNNQFTTLGILGTAPESGNQISTAGGLNDSDVVIGTSTNGQPGGCCAIGGSESAVIWKPFGTPASTTPFPLGQIDSDAPDCQPSGEYTRFCYSAGTNINDAGTAAGYAEMYAGYQDFPTVPFALQGADPGTLAPGDPSSDALVSSPGSTSYETSGINAAGKVVVTPNPATPSDGDSSAIEPGGTAIPFDTSRTLTILTYNSINNLNQVIGTDVSGANFRAKLWQNGTEVDLPPLSGGVGSTATAINNNGDVVGASVDAGGCPRAVLWQAGSYGSPIDLNTLIGATTDELLNANGINDYGQIIGQGGSCVDNNGYTSNANPWLLTPPFHGTVLDAKDKPIVGAVVKITGTTSQMVAVNTSATTGSDGSYELDLEPGTYTLDVTGTPGQPPPGQPAGGVWHTDTCSGTVPVGGKCALTIGQSAPGGANFRYSLPDFEAENVEITQGIQDITWDAPATVPVPGSGATPGGSYTGVPLVKDVPTVVRFYADVANDTDAEGQDATAELYGYSGAAGSLSQLSGSPLSASTRSLRVGHSLAIDRTVPDGAYTFTVPPSWTEHGPLTLVAEVNPKTSDTERTIKECIESSCDDNNAYALSQVPFKVTRPVTIRPIEITYEYPNAGGHGFTRVLPPDLASHFVRAAQLLPLAPGNLIVQPFPQAIVDISPEVELLVNYDRAHGLHLTNPNLSDCEKVSGCAADLLGYEFDAINRLVTLSHSSASRTYLAAYEPGTTGVTWPTKGLSILGLDNPPRPLTSTTHELLHLLGFEHASTACGGGSNGQIGVSWPPDQLGYIQGIGLNRVPDSGGRGLYDIIAPGVGEPQYYDVMSYCNHGNDKVAWLSTVNWTKFVQDGGVANDIPDPPAQASTAAAGSDLLVDASMAPGGQAQIEGAVGAPGPATRSTSSPYHLEALGRGGKVIANIGVAPQAITESPLRMFTATLPAQGVTSLALSVEGHVMAKLKKPSPAPTVKLVLPRHGLRATRKGLALKWRAKGARGARLTAIVEFEASAKGGWQTVIAGLEAHSYTIALKQFARARKVQVRVVISDGFSSAIATSRTIKLP